MNKLTTNGSKNWMMLAVITILFLIVYPQTFDKKVAILGDNASYYILGKSISEGFGYSNYFTPEKTPHKHFPPGYPFLISLIMIFTSNIQVIKIINGLFLFGTILLAYFTSIKIQLLKPLGLVISLAILLNANLLYYGSIMMSEVPFAFFSLLAFYLVLKINWETNYLKNPLFYGLLVVLIYCFYLRAFGVAIVGSTILFLIAKRNIKASVLIGLGFIFGILPWQIRSAQLGGSSQFTVMFRKNFYAPEEGQIDIGDMIERIISNFNRIIFIELPESLFPASSQATTQEVSALNVIVGLLVAAIVIYGSWKLKRYGLLLGSYILITLGILFVWPDCFSSMRYLAPVAPISVILFFSGLYFIVDYFIKKIHTSNKFSPYFLLIFLFFSFTPVKNLIKSAEMDYPLTWAHYFSIAKWAKENTPKDAIISCRKPFLFHLFSDRITTHYKYSDDDLDLINHLRMKGVDYVVYDQLGFSTTPRYLGNAINKNMDLFSPVIYIGPDKYRTYLFKLKEENTE